MHLIGASTNTTLHAFDCKQGSQIEKESESNGVPLRITVRVGRKLKPDRSDRADKINYVILLLLLLPLILYYHFLKGVKLNTLALLLTLDRVESGGDTSSVWVI